MSEQQIKQVEISIDAAKAAIDLGDALERLSNNPDFKKIISKGYFEQNASRLVLLKASPVTADESTQKRINDDIIGIGSLYQYFLEIQRNANQMSKSLADDETTREELLSEDL